MKIVSQTPAPDFTINDVNGSSISLNNFRGRKVFISFYRNVGCPICNLRFHDLEKNAAFFKTNNIVLISIYESSQQLMKQYIKGENFYSIMIPNPDESLYQLYYVEKNMSKVLKGMLHGAMAKMGKGNKLFNTKIKQDGNANRISADFLIDENGKVVKAYYGKYVGDHLPISEIK